MRLLLLLLLLCGCATQPKPKAESRTLSAAAPIAQAVVTSPAILALTPLPTRPATDWRAYYASGTVAWFISSNACAAWRLSYTSNLPCWLWYNHRSEEARTLHFGGSANNFVNLSGFVRVGGALPAGANTVEIPMPRESVGFVTLKTEP